MTIKATNNCTYVQTIKVSVKNVTAAPIVTSPIYDGATSVSGTSLEADGTSIEVYVNGVSVGITTVTNNEWSISNLTGLTFGQIVTAKATLAGKCASVDSNQVTTSANP